LEFDWDSANIDHLARHHVLPHEAEEAMCGFAVELSLEQHPGDELRIRSVGQTLVGRILVLVTTWRGNAIRVITAFDAPRITKEHYLMRRFEEHYG
jgi:uncharacterized protein